MTAPAITAISPSSGPTAGGTVVTIQGTNLDGATSVLFGGAAATAIAVEGSTVIIATSPPGSGQVNVGVATGGGSSPIVTASQFSYDAVASSTSDGSFYVDPALNAELVQTLIGVLTSATSPDAVEAQNIIMRRIALEGDVVGSRLALPQTVSNFGGMINLLTSLGETTMREQALAGVLGVAGPNPPLGWLTNTPPLSMVSRPNDRPAGSAQPTIPLSVLVRSDLVGAVNAAVAAVHQYGATLPFASASVLQLPPAAPGVAVPTDVLGYLGRELDLAPAAALAAPASDPLAVVRAAGTSDPWQVAARVLTATSTTVTPADYDAVQCTPTSNSITSLVGASLVPLPAILADAGFYPAASLPEPATSADLTWTRFTNVGGLVAGVTRLGDELSLLYTADTVANSIFAAVVDRLWDGTAFAAAG